MRTWRRMQPASSDDRPRRHPTLEQAREGGDGVLEPIATGDGQHAQRLARRASLSGRESNVRLSVSRRLHDWQGGGFATARGLEPRAHNRRLWHAGVENAQRLRSDGQNQQRGPSRGGARAVVSARSRGGTCNRVEPALCGLSDPLLGSDHHDSSAGLATYYTAEQAAAARLELMLSFEPRTLRNRWSRSDGLGQAPLLQRHVRLSTAN